MPRDMIPMVMRIEQAPADGSCCILCAEPVLRVASQIALYTPGGLPPGGTGPVYVVPGIVCESCADEVRDEWDRERE